MPAAAAVNVVEQEDANRIYEAVPSAVVGQSRAIPSRFIARPNISLCKVLGTCAILTAMAEGLGDSFVQRPSGPFGPYFGNQARHLAMMHKWRASSIALWVAGSDFYPKSDGRAAERPTRARILMSTRGFD